MKIQYGLLLLLALFFLNTHNAIAQDYDGDGIANSIDFDNDNDGILDAEECGATDRISNGVFPTSGGNTNTLTGWTIGGSYAASGAWASPTGRINLNSNGLEFRRVKT